MSTLLGKKGRERKTHNFSVQISLFLSYTQRVPHRATTESKLRLTLLGCFFFGGECAQWPNACTAETQGGRALSTTKQWRKVNQKSLVQNDLYKSNHRFRGNCFSADTS